MAFSSELVIPATASLRLQPEARSALPARPPAGKARTSGEAASSRRRSRGRRACPAGPHLPVSHRSALEFAVGVGPQARQLLLARKGPVPLLAAAVVHGAALAGSDTGTATATHQETAATHDRGHARPRPREDGDQDQGRARDVTVTYRHPLRRFRSPWGVFRRAGGRSLGAPGPWAGRESEGCGLAESESGRGRGRADWAQHRGEEGSRVPRGCVCTSKAKVFQA